MHEVSRRTMIKGAVAATGALAFGADFKWSTGIGESKYRIDEAAKIQIDGLAERMESSISAQGGETFSPNPSAISKTLAQLAYVEGGIEEAEKVTGFIVERGLDIKIQDMEFIHSTAAAVTGRSFLNKEHRIEVIFSDQVISEYMNERKDNPVFLHEFYHVVQEARNEKTAKQFVYAKLGLIFVVAPLGSGTYLYKGLIKEEKEKGITRRSLLRKGRDVAVASSFGVFSVWPARAFMGLLDPEEHQAYAKTSEHSPFKITSDSSFQELADNFFIPITR